MDPKDAKAWNSFGVPQYFLKKYDEAEMAYRRALELDLKYADAWYNLGVVLKDLKRYEEAEKAFRKARAL
jgi:superkiller protein 3